MKKIDPVLNARLETLLVSMGYDYVGAEVLPMNGSKVFRIFIDSPNGVSVDDCSKVSRQVSAMMDVEDPFQSRYELKHFEQHVGSQVKIRLQSPINQQRQFKGILKRVEGESIHLLVEGSEKEVVLPYAAVDKANIIGDVRINRTDD